MNTQNFFKLLLDLYAEQERIKVRYSVIEKVSKRKQSEKNSPQMRGLGFIEKREAL